MRSLVIALCAFLALASVAPAQSEKPVFAGLGMTLTKGTDAMTDEQVCSLSIDQGPWRIAIMGPAQFAVLAGNDKTLFAPDEQHLIRVGTDKPVPLVYVQKRNALVVTDPSVAASIVKAIVAGQEIKIRYFTFPSHTFEDVQLKNPNVGYGYQRGVQACGWKSVGGSGDLVPAKLSVYTSKEHAGYAAVSVEGNPDLGLKKDFDSSGGGCYIQVGIESLFGMKKGKWVMDKVDLSGRISLLIRDPDGKIEFSAKIPKNYNLRDGSPFPEGGAAALAAWKLDPTGTVELDPPDRYSKVAMLYGFREVWTWGVQNCGFPALAQ